MPASRAPRPSSGRVVPELGYESFADSRADGSRQVMIAVTADESLLGPRAQRALDRLRATAYCG